MSLSPDSPTEMLRTSFSMRSSRMGFALLSLPSACGGMCQSCILDDIGILADQHTMIGEKLVSRRWSC